MPSIKEFKPVAAPTAQQSGNTPSGNTTRVIAVGNQPDKLCGTEKRASLPPVTTHAPRPQRPPAPSKDAIKAAKQLREPLTNAQQEPSTAALIKDIAQQLAMIAGGLPLTKAQQMLQALSNIDKQLVAIKLGDTGYHDAIRQRGVVQNTMDEIMRRATEQLYKDNRLDIERSSSWTYKLLAKIPFTKQRRVATCLKNLGRNRPKN